MRLLKMADIEQHEKTSNNGCDSEEEVAPHLEEHGSSVGDQIAFAVSSTQTSLKSDAVDAQVKVHSCDICKKVFARKLYLTYHMRIHTGARPYTCDLCNKTFRQKSALSRHVLIHKMDGSFSCDQCNFSFKTQIALDSHKCILPSNQSDSDKMKMKSHLSNRKVFECEVCGKKIHRKDKFSLHMQMHNGIKPYKCEECGKFFRQKNHLQRHSFLHTGEKPHHCDICGMSFREKRKLKEHTRQHSGEMPYECSVCNRKFALSASLRKHLISFHKGESMYSCSKCCRLFTFFKAYSSHNCSVCDDPVAEGGQVCDTKTPIISDVGTEKREAILITGDNLLTPEKIKLMIDATSVKMEETNTGKMTDPLSGSADDESVNSVMNNKMHPYFNSLFTCGVCGREFKRSEYLTRHMQIHTGDRPYTCKQCGMSFSQSAHCRAHERVHDNIRPFECEVCSKRFVTSSGLKKHNLVHVADKPFVCNSCGKGFKCVNYLTKHVARVHEKIAINVTSEGDANTSVAETPSLDESPTFPCQNCGLNFESKSLRHDHVCSYSKRKSLKRKASSRSKKRNSKKLRVDRKKRQRKHSKKDADDISGEVDGPLIGAVPLPCNTTDDEPNIDMICGDMKSFLAQEGYVNESSGEDEESRPLTPSQSDSENADS